LPLARQPTFISAFFLLARFFSYLTLVKRTCEHDIPAISEAISQNYFKAALQGWNQDWKPQINSLKSLNVAESCLCVGTLSRDLPAGEKELKEFGLSARDVYKEIPNTPRKTSDATGASVYQLQRWVRNAPITP
jgi:hypothetical protein